MGVVHDGLVEKGSERVKGGVRDGHPGMGKESVKGGGSETPDSLAERRMYSGIPE